MRPIVRLAVLALCLFGCAHVERPRLTTRDVEWLGISGDGLHFRMHLAAYNPNTFELPLNDLQATMSLEGQDTGSSVTNLQATLPPQREIPVTVDVVMPLAGGITAMGVVAQTNVMRYRIDGTITVHHYINVNTRFTHEGTVSRDMLMRNAPAGVQTVMDYVRPFVSSGGSSVQVGTPPPTQPGAQPAAQPGGRSNFGH